MTFDKLIEEASNIINSLSDGKQKSLKESLDHGKALLKNELEMKAYLHFYGDMHRMKLKMAFEKLPETLWKNGSISIIDYGCGQGIASMVLIDHLKEKAADLSNYSYLHYERLRHRPESSVRIDNGRVERLIFTEHEEGIEVRLIEIDSTHYGNKR